MIRASDSSRSLINRGRSMMRRSLPALGSSLPAITLPAPSLRGAPHALRQRYAPTNPLGRGWTPAAEGVAAGASSPSAPVVGTRRLQAARQRVLARQQAERDWDVPPPRNAELLPEYVAMSLGGSWRDTEHQPDFVVRQTLRDQLDDLPLPRGYA